jgi:hypothetical protein
LLAANPGNGVIDPNELAARGFVGCNFREV